MCRDGLGAGSIDATVKIDADDTNDASPDEPDGDAPPPADASVLGCDPLTHAGCSAPTARCGFIATNALAPYDGYFACVGTSGNNQNGEACRYDTPAGEGHHDDCARGFICGAEQRCRAVCERGREDACDGDVSLCEDPSDVLSPDVSPFGLCAPSQVIDGGIPDAAI